MDFDSVRSTSDGANERKIVGEAAKKQREIDRSEDKWIQNLFGSWAFVQAIFSSFGFSCNIEQSIAIFHLLFS